MKADCNGINTAVCMFIYPCLGIGNGLINEHGTVHGKRYPGGPVRMLETARVLGIDTDMAVFARYFCG